MPILLNEAVAASGIPAKQAEAIRKVAAAREEVIILRKVDKAATPLIEASYPARKKGVSGKLATWGPHAGLIAVDSRFAPPSTEGKHTAKIDKAIGDAAAKVTAVQLRLTEARINRLLADKLVTKAQKDAEGWSIEATDPAGKTVVFDAKKADGGFDLFVEKDEVRKELAGWKAGKPLASKLVEYERDTAKKEKLPLPYPLLVLASETSGLPFTSDYKVFAVCPLLGTAEVPGWDKPADKLDEKSRLALLELQKAPKPTDDPTDVSHMGETVRDLNKELASTGYTGGELFHPVDDKAKGDPEKSDLDFPVFAFEPTRIVGLVDAKEFRDYLARLRKRGYYLTLAPAWREHRSWDKEPFEVVSTQWGDFQPGDGFVVSAAAALAAADTKTIRDKVLKNDKEPPPADPKKGRIEFSYHKDHLPQVANAEFAAFLKDENNYPAKMRNAKWDEMIPVLWNKITHALEKERTEKAALDILDYCVEMGMKPLESKSARAFWSGVKGKEGASEAGGSDKAMKALETSDIAKLFDSLNGTLMKGNPWAISGFIWGTISKFFGAGAIGNCHVFMEEGFTINNVFWNTEFPQMRKLQEAGVVHKIVVHVWNKLAKPERWDPPFAFESNKLKLLMDKNRWVKDKSKPDDKDAKVPYRFEKPIDLAKFRRAIDKLRDGRRSLDKELAKLAAGRKPEDGPFEPFEKFIAKCKEPTFASIKREVGGVTVYLFQWESEEDSVIWFPHMALYEAAAVIPAVDDFLCEEWGSFDQVPSQVVVVGNSVIYEKQVQGVFDPKTKKWHRNLALELMKSGKASKEEVGDLLAFKDELPPPPKTTEQGRSDYMTKIDLAKLEERVEKIEGLLA